MRSGRGDANKQAETALVVPPSIAGGQPPTDDDSDNAPALIDRLATMEEALPKWRETLQSVKSAIELVGQVMTEGKADIDRADRAGALPEGLSSPGR